VRVEVVSAIFSSLFACDLKADTRTPSSAQDDAARGPLLLPARCDKDGPREADPVCSEAGKDLTARMAPSSDAHDTDNLVYKSDWLHEGRAAGRRRRESTTRCSCRRAAVRARSHLAL
jgi:hypothetical protein